ncbi:MAG: multidrug effflux MFS transporter [Chlamydiota bacterium]
MTRKEIKYLLLIITIFVGACIETDIFLPAFPDMISYFSTTEEAIQSLLTWNFIGICLSGPFYGPISDSYGRKKPLMTALSLFLLGSLFTLCSQTLEMMLFGRLLQGLGCGGCFTLGTTVMFDTFQSEKAIRALNLINSIVPFMMASAPLLGGYLNYTFGFRSNFLTISLFAVLSFLITLFFLPETHPLEKRKPMSFGKITKDYKVAFSTLPFWQLTFVVSLAFAGYMAFLSTTAVLFVMEFGVSKAVFPLFQATVIGAWLAGSLTCSRAIKKWGIDKVKRIGTTNIAIGGIWIVCSAIMSPENPYSLTSGILIYTFGINWTQGLYFPECMELLPEIKGVTASLLTSTRLLVTAGIIALCSHLYDMTVYPLVIILSGIVMTSLATMFLYERSKKLKNQQANFGT